MSPSIGFDFDECLAQAYTLVPFVLFFEILLPKALKLSTIKPSLKLYLEKFKGIFYERIAANEVAKKGIIFRPSFLNLLPKLIKLRNQGKINHLFIYSNNGLLELIDAVDHILALVLKKSPYLINDNELILENGQLHTLTPRIHINNPCRVSTETRDVSGFSEKTLTGIQTCLNESISAENLWFIDDSREHVSLMQSLGSQYIPVEPYKIFLSNTKLAKFFLESFPVEAFIPGNDVSLIVLTELNRLFMKQKNNNFRPTGNEGKDTLIEKLKIPLREFSPRGSGKLIQPWKEDYVNLDYKFLEKSLLPVINTLKTTNNPISHIYTPPVGGKLPVGKLPIGKSPTGPSVSLSNKNFKLRTRRKRQK